MELKGERILPLPREQVWAALNDPAVLQKCIPGCDTFESVGENEYKIVMTAAVGPVKARFNGKLTLSDIQAPISYKLEFSGSGGAAGFGKGSAQVELQQVEGGTSLTYGVNAQVGGKLAQVGARLIDGVAKKMADEFFTRFSQVLAAGAASAAPVAEPVSTDAAAPAVAASAIPPAAPSVAPSVAPSTTSAPKAPAPAAAPAAASGTSRWLWPVVIVVVVVVAYFVMR